MNYFVFQNVRQPCSDVIDVLCLLADIENDVLNVVLSNTGIDYAGPPQYLNSPDVTSWLSSMFKVIPSYNK